MAHHHTLHTETWNVPPGSELRFQVGHDALARLSLQSGTAEVFGAELQRNDRPLTAAREYYFGAKSVAVYTYYGCRLRLEVLSPKQASADAGGPGMDGSDTRSFGYVANRTPMPFYTNTHGRLESMRDYARSELLRSRQQQQSRGSAGFGGSARGRDRRSLSEVGWGPRVVICGGTDSGKSTLAKILVNYAARSGRRPILVDVDVGQGEISVPGTLGAAAVDAAMVRPGWEGTSDAFDLTSSPPVVYSYGHTSPAENPELYRLLLKRLAHVTRQRMSGDGREAEAERTAGCVINTCGWTRGLGLRLLFDTIRAFSADLVIVVGSDELTHRIHEFIRRDPALSGRVTGQGSKGGNDGGSRGKGKDGGGNWPAWQPSYGRAVVMTLPRSAGVTQRSTSLRRSSRRRRIRQYFYGSGEQWDMLMAALMNAAAARDKSAGLSGILSSGDGDGGDGGGSGLLKRSAVLSAMYGSDASVCNAYSSLNPVEIEVGFDDCDIFRVGLDTDSASGGGEPGAGGAKLATELLPVGQTSQLDPTSLHRVEPVKENESRLLHSLLAVSHYSMGAEEAGGGAASSLTAAAVRPADKAGEGKGAGVDEDVDGVKKDWSEPAFAKAVLEENTAGFVYLRAIDWERRVFKLLSPCGGPLPSRVLLAGSLKWFDE